MGNNPLQVAVRTDKPFYKPGDIVTGSILVNAPQAYPCSKIVLYITGHQKSWFRGQPTKNKAPFNTLGFSQGSIKLIDTIFVVYQWGKAATLKGQYTFPFTFSLPSHFPGSFFEKTNNYQGQIKYNIKVVCVSQKKNSQAEQQLIIRQQQKAATHTLYGQTFAYPKSCFFQKGVSKICCYFDKNFYVRGNQCIVVCEVDNFKCQIDLQRVICRLKKKVTLRSQRNEIKEITQTVCQVDFPGVRTKDAYIGQSAKKNSFSLRYKNGQLINPSTSGNFVTCQYFIEVQPIFKGCFVSGIQNFNVKVVILQQGAHLQELQVPVDGWRPQQYRRSMIILDYGGQNDLLESMQSEKQIEKKNLNQNPYQ